MERNFTVSIKLADNNPYVPTAVQHDVDKKKIVKELCKIIQMIEDGYLGGSDNKETYWEIR